MEKSRKRRLVWVCILAFLVVAWTATIFAQSAKNGEESTEDSNKVLEIIEEVAESVGIDAEVSSHFVRKMAHFSEYLILGVLASLLLLVMGGGWRLGGAFAYAVLVAVCDEFIVQRLSEGRAPMVTDVLIDTSGAFVGLLAVVAIFWLMDKVRQNRNKTIL